MTEDIWGELEKTVERMVDAPKNMPRSGNTVPNTPEEISRCLREHEALKQAHAELLRERDELQNEVARLKEFEWMYNELNK